MGTDLECLFLHSLVFKYFVPSEVLAAVVHCTLVFPTLYKIPEVLEKAVLPPYLNNSRVFSLALLILSLCSRKFY